jgi:hypothetical protein
MLPVDPATVMLPSLWMSVTVQWSRFFTMDSWWVRSRRSLRRVTTSSPTKISDPPAFSQGLLMSMSPFMILDCWASWLRRAAVSVVLAIIATV